jgi:hypothetical protein
MESSIAHSRQPISTPSFVPTRSSLALRQARATLLSARCPTHPRSSLPLTQRCLGLRPLALTYLTVRPRNFTHLCTHTQLSFHSRSLSSDHIAFNIHGPQTDPPLNQAVCPIPHSNTAQSPCIRAIASWIFSGRNTVCTSGWKEL